MLWELACRIFKIDTFVLPAPSQIFEAAVRYWSPLLKNSFVTLWTTLAGFALAVAFGIVLGIIVGWSRTIYRGLYPVMIGFNSIPKVAVVPILIIWFGIGIVPAILTAFLISFFPIVVNVATGLATMEPELEDVLRALGARKLDIMLKVGIPRTQPYLFGFAQDRHHARLRRRRDVGDDRRQCRPRPSDGAGRIELPDAARVRLPARTRDRRHRDVRRVRLRRVLFHALGLPLVHERGCLSASTPS